MSTDPYASRWSDANGNCKFEDWFPVTSNDGLKAAETGLENGAVVIVPTGKLFSEETPAGELCSAKY
jgi:hypothetical protein